MATLKGELESCKQQLSVFQQNEIEIGKYLTKLRLKIQELVEEVIIATKSNNDAAISIALENLLAKYGVHSEERTKTINTLVKTTIELIVPSCYAYLMWAAENDSGFFKETDKGGSTPSEVSKTNEWDEVFTEVNVSKEEYKEMLNTKEILKKSFIGLRGKINQYLTCHQEVINETKVISELVRENVLNKLTGHTIGSYLNGMEKVEHCDLTLARFIKSGS